MALWKRLLVLSFLWGSFPAQAAEKVTVYHENILGTTLFARLEVEDRNQVESIEKAMLGEIERLRKILSVYDQNSELSLWLKTPGQPTCLSPELNEILKRSEGFQSQTKGAFNPRVASACGVWKAAQASGSFPTHDALTQSIVAANAPAWRIDPKTGQTTRLGNHPVTFDAIAKGYIVDRAAQAAKKAGAISITVQIGGDLMVLGNASQDVEIADPQADYDNAPGLARVRLGNRALATSGGYRRGYSIAGQWYSHIIDPRTARPVDHISSSTVIAADCASADALATALSVLTIQEGLALIEGLPGTACLLIDKLGKRWTSRSWSGLELEQPVSSHTGDQGESGLWKEGMELVVQLEINRPANEGRGYRRPYVAVWLEDKDEFPVKTLALWLQTSGKGLRWLPDLKRWNKTDGVRKLVDETDLVKTVSSATRSPGKYKLVWDGKDDGGKRIKEGTYTLFLEAAREHGTYQIIKEPLNFEGKAFNKTLKGNVEIKGATVEYRAKAASR